MSLRREQYLGQGKIAKVGEIIAAVKLPPAPAKTTECTVSPAASSARDQCAIISIGHSSLGRFVAGAALRSSSDDLSDWRPDRRAAAVREVLRNS
jgi:hypothetical protein